MKFKKHTNLFAYSFRFQRDEISTIGTKSKCQEALGRSHSLPLLASGNCNDSGSNSLTLSLVYMPTVFSDSFFK